jgi:hypothetical protein
VKRTETGVVLPGTLERDIFRDYLNNTDTISNFFGELLVHAGRKQPLIKPNYFSLRLQGQGE